jgi:hypothetical protein
MCRTGLYISTQGAQLFYFILGKYFQSNITDRTVHLNTGCSIVLFYLRKKLFSIKHPEHYLLHHVGQCLVVGVLRKLEHLEEDVWALGGAAHVWVVGVEAFGSVGVFSLGEHVTRGSS